MKIIFKIVLLLLISVLSSFIGTLDKNIIMSFDGKHSIDNKRIAAFMWNELSDTNKYQVHYIQVNFLNFPDKKYAGKNILSYKDSIPSNSILLTGKQQLNLLNIISDTNNFSEGDCGTFHLNAGFLILERGNICATIDIGCGYSQWIFNPDNYNAKYGHFKEEKFKAVEKLLDKINRNRK